MPRLPDFSGAGPVRGGLVPVETSQRITQAAERFGNTVTRIGLAQQAEENARERMLLLADGRAEFQRGLNAIQADIEQMDDPNEIQPFYDERVSDLTQSLMSNTPDEMVRAELEGFAIGASALGKANAIKTENDTRKNLSLASLIQNQRGYLDAIAIGRSTGNAAQVAAAKEMARDDILMNDYLDPVEQQKALMELDGLESLEHANYLLDTNPSELHRIASSAELFSEVLPGFGPDKRMGVKADAEAELKRRQTAFESAQADMQEEVARGFVDRIFDPATMQTQGRPSFADIAASPLEAKTKEHFYKLLRDESEGAQLNAIDHGLVNELYLRVHDENHPRPITRYSQLTPFIGRGLPRAEAEKFRTFLNSEMTDVEKETEAIRKDALKFAKTQIADVVFGKKNDPIGEERFYRFSVLFNAAFDKGISEGKNPAHLVDPTHPDSIMDMMNPFVLDFQEQLRLQADRATNLRNREKTNKQRRRDDETPEQYLQRMGVGEN